MSQIVKPIERFLMTIIYPVKKILSLIFFKAGPYKTCSLLCILMLCRISEARAQQETDYAIHANIIYRFTKYIDWPENKKSGDFIIGIVGDSPLYDELKTFVTNKMVGDQKIVIKKFSASASSFNCHILFINEDESSNFKKITDNTSGIPTLIVSESDGLASKGSCINFVIEDEHLKLEINKNNIEHRNLSIASELLKLGKIVK